ncbi:hypothetical protein U1Q18_026920 [Sarracenia purpurea var. burkii]
MGEDKRQMRPSPCSLYSGDANDEYHWSIMAGEDDDHTFCNNSTSSLEDATTVSNGSDNSSISSDMANDDDDDVSSSSYSTSSPSSGPLCDLSELMAQLPIKRGLSKFYDGKSQSFTSLSRVTSIKDLPKKETSYRRKMKASKSYGGGLDSYKSHTHPKPTISKKTSRASLSFPTRRGSFVNTCRPPLIPIQKEFGIFLRKG